MVPLLWPPSPLFFELLIYIVPDAAKPHRSLQRGRTCWRAGLFWVWRQGMKLSLQGGNVFEHKWLLISRAAWRPAPVLWFDWYPVLTMGVYTDSVQLSNIYVYLQTHARVHWALSLPPLSLLFTHALALLLEETLKNFRCAILHVLHKHTYILYSLLPRKYDSSLQLILFWITENWIWIPKVGRSQGRNYSVVCYFCFKQWIL